MRIRKRHLASLVALLAAAGAIVVVWSWTPLVPDRVGALVTENLLREHGLRVQIAAVRRTWSGEFIFQEPRVHSVADTNATVLRADALRVRIRRPWSALRGRVTFARLRLDRPRIVLPATLPGIAAAVPGERTGFPRVVVEELQITDGSLRDSRGAMLAEHAELRLGIQSRRSSVRVEVKHLAGRLGADSLAVLDGAARCIWRADTLRVQGASLQLASTRVAGEATVVPAARTGHLSGTLSPLDLDELAARLPPLARRHGQLSGSARIEWRGGSRSFSGRVNGQVDSLRLQEVEFDVVVERTRWVVRRLAGLANEQRLQARATGARDEPHWEAELRLEDADLGRLVPARYRPALLATLPPHSLRGALRLRHPSRDSLRVDVALGRSQVGEVAFDSCAGTAILADGALRVPNLQLASPLGELTAGGMLRHDSLEAEFDLRTARIDRLLALAGRADARGDLAVRGRLYGPPGRPHFAAEGSAESLAVGPLSLWAASLAGWGQLHGRSPEIDLELRADSLRARGHVLRDLSADLAYRNRRLDVRRAEASSGDTLFAGAGRLERLPADWDGARLPTNRLQLETALVRFGYTELRVEDPATVWWRPGAMKVDSLRVTSRGGRLALHGVLDHTAHRIDAWAGIADFDLAYIRRFIPSLQHYGGIASGWLSAAGDLSATPLQGHVSVLDGQWNGLQVDSLAFDVRTREERTELQAVRLVTSGGTLDGELQFGTRLHLGRWLGRGAVAAAAPWERASLSGRLRLRDLDVAALWGARAPGATQPGWGARLSSSLELGGTLSRPELAMAGNATAVHISRLGIGAVRFDAAWSQDRLRLRHLEIAVDGQTAHAEATIPVGLRLPGGAIVERDAPLEAKIVVPRTSFAAVERFLPLFEPPPVEIARGELEGDLRLGGTFDAPVWSGGFQVQRASFALRDLEEVYRDVHATGVFEGNRLYVRSLRGRSGEKGTLDGEGRLDFQRLRLSGYEWEFTLRQVPVRSIPDVNAIVSGNLEIRGEQIGQTLVPDVRGNLAVQAAEIRMEFVSAGEAAQPVVDTDVPEWLADVTLAADKGNVWIRNSVVDAELVGNLRFIRRREGEVQGLVRVKRGTYSYLIHRFEITRGELDFSRTGGFFDPELAIEARRGRPGDRTYVTMSGRASAPQLSFRSDRAEASSDQIQQELLAVGGPSSQAAQTAIADFAEQTLRDLALLSDVSIDPADAEEGTAGDASATRSAFRYNVSAAREISNRVFLIYTQGVNSDLAQRVAVEIDVNRWLLLETLYERRSVTEAGIDQPQNAYELNLKYRYEY